MSIPFSLTPLQHAMVAASLAAPRSGVNVEQWIITLREDVDGGALEGAWRDVVARHSMLRTVIDARDPGAMRQCVLTDLAHPWMELDWSSSTVEAASNRWEEFLAEDRRRDFRFDEADSVTPLWRVVLVRCSDHTRLLCTYHHALLDGRSLALLGRELFARYDHRRNGATAYVDETPAPQFAEFVACLAAHDHEPSATYWRNLLADQPPPVLPYQREARSAGSPKNLATAEVVRTLSQDEWELLRNAAHAAGVTVHNFVQAAWALTLAMNTGADDHTFGSVRACRKQPVAGSDMMLGMLIHTVPFRVQIDWSQSLAEFTHGIRDQQRALREHETTPPARIMRAAGLAGDRTLFPTILMFTDQPAAAMFEVDGRPHPTRSVELREQSDAPWTLVVEAARELTLRLEYNPSQSDSRAAEKLVGQVCRLLAAFPDQLSRPLAELPAVDDATLTLVSAWSSGAAAVPESTTLVELFQRQVEFAPNAIALRCTAGSFSYFELSRLADAAACSLRTHGVRPGDRVCLSLARSAEWIALILGIWKVRAVYVPLDAQYPEARREYILRDASPKLFVVDAMPQQIAVPEETSVVAVAELFAPDGGSPRCDVSAASPEVPAVILYTSGSTGQPKGVVLTHGNLSAQNQAVRRAMDYRSLDRTTTLSSPCFDASLEEIFAPLCAGALLVLPAVDVLSSLQRLQELARAEQLTVLDMPTSLWRELTNGLYESGCEFPGSVRAIMTGGERATAATFARFLQVGGGRIRWFNAYGPTEATICATLYEHDPRQTAAGEAIVTTDEPPAPPIGRPIAGAMVAVVDRCGRPVAPGVAGEVYIGGAGVGLGYWNRDELTQERFVSRPYAALPEGKYYRTGDLALWNDAGQLEYVGRIDGQVKLRGFRIEPAEIEAVLSRHESVRDVVVSVATSPFGTEVLAAFVVPQPQAVFDPDGLRAFAARQLPSYMVPQRLVALAALPLTPNGKTDVARLPDPFSADPARDDVPQRVPTELESRIMEVWQTMLPTDSLRLDDDFFQLGGDSLKAMTLAARLESKLETKLAVNLVYRARTPAALARELACRDVTYELAPLVNLRAGDGARPLFLIHSLGGDAWIYREVVEELPGGFAIYGLQIPGLDGTGTTPDTIEASAELFITLVKSLQPVGPYRVAGYSSGGLVAFEMARQLAGRGESVEFLGLIDSGLPTLIEAAAEPGNVERLRGVVRSIPGLVKEIWAMPRGRRIPRIGGFLRRLSRRMMGGDAQSEGELTERDMRECFAEDVSMFSPQRLDLIRRHFEAIEHYAPRPYAGDAHLFRSTRQPVFGTQSATLGWERLIHGRLTVADVFGAHAVLMKRPHAAELARALSAVLQQLEREVASEPEVELQLMAEAPA
ncbi:MAG: hypothetical protein C0483_08245 [Pirellula sp.]|nr:hypothetical protein [Pirellula sp.]